MTEVSGVKCSRLTCDLTPKVEYPVPATLQGWAQTEVAVKEAERNGLGSS